MNNSLTDLLLAEILQIGGNDVNLTNKDVYDLADKYAALVWELNDGWGGDAIWVSKEKPIRQGWWGFKVWNCQDSVYGDLIGEVIKKLGYVFKSYDEDAYYDEPIWDYTDIPEDTRIELVDRLAELINDISNDPDNYYDFD